MTKTETKKLLQLVTNVLYARRSGNVKREQAAFLKLRSYCERFNVDPEDAIEQGREYLKRNALAAVMNGIV